MSDSRLVAEEPAPIVPQHYQLICGVALGVLCVVQIQQGMLLFGLVVLLFGVLGILLRVPVSPLSILVPLVGGQVYAQYVFPSYSPAGRLRVEDVILCAATLAYIAGHYRLLSLWSSILPADPRQRYHKGAAAIVPMNRLGKVVSQYRPVALMTSGEIAWFVLQLPLFALLAQGAWIVLATPHNLFELRPQWLQFMHLVWGLALILFVAGQLLRYVRLARMDHATARMLLQDVLWQETRGEQRRIGRWLAWMQRRGKPSAPAQRKGAPGA